MPAYPPIFLALDNGSSALEIIIWIVAGVIWFMSQAAAARKKRARKAPGGSEARPAAGGAGGGDAPTPDELAEIFKRLGTDIPGTPQPSQRPPPPPPPIRQVPRPAARPVHKTAAAARVQPKLAPRLARARQEAEQTAQRAEAERIALQAIVPGVQSRAGETRALETATQHTGTILPRLYAMSMRLINLPTLPMPGLDRRSYSTRPFRTKLRGRREVRDALIAQTFLQPPKSVAR